MQWVAECLTSQHHVTSARSGSSARLREANHRRRTLHFGIWRRVCKCLSCEKLWANGPACRCQVHRPWLIIAVYFSKAPTGRTDTARSHVDAPIVLLSSRSPRVQHKKPRADDALIGRIRPACLQHDGSEKRQLSAVRRKRNGRSSERALRCVSC